MLYGYHIVQIKTLYIHLKTLSLSTQQLNATSYGLGRFLCASSHDTALEADEPDTNARNLCEGVMLTSQNECYTTIFNDGCV